MPPEYTPAVIARFFAKVGPDGRWTGQHTEKGYGRFTLRKRNRRAHRVAWEIANRRRVPAGLLVCHACDVRDCVLPGCLWLGTALDNARDAIAKGRFDTSGEKNGAARLTNVQVRKIRRQYAGDLNGAALAKIYGVSKRTIYRVINKEKWKKV